MVVHSEVLFTLLCFEFFHNKTLRGSLSRLKKKKAK